MRTRPPLPRQAPSTRGATSAVPPTPLQIAQKERERRFTLLEQRENVAPLLLRHIGKPAIILEEDLVFRSERLSKKDLADLKKKKREVLFQRTVNHFFISQDHPEGEDCTMVTPEFKEEKEEQEPYFLVGFASPMTDGARRAGRALAGYTPIYQGQSHPNLWQMQTQVVGAWVGTPRMGHVKFFGCKVPCVIFPSWENKSIEYAVQRPDPEYKPFWEATISDWAVEHEMGRAEALVPWTDVDLSAPRPWWMPEWSMGVLRLEHGLNRDHPDDPPRRAMLGLCRYMTGPNRRAPTTEAEWLAIPADQCDSGDDEAGLSDAGSINDDIEKGLPTARDWDPVTKKSASPRGNKAHPYPKVIEQELRRNKEYEQKIAQARARPPPASPASNSSCRRTVRSAAPLEARDMDIDVEMSATEVPDAPAPPPPAPAPAPPAPAPSSPAPSAPAPPAPIAAAPPAPAPCDVITTPPSPSTAPDPIESNTPLANTSRQVNGTGPPRSFAPPLPNNPTVREGYRGGRPLVPRAAAEARIRDQDRGLSVVPQ